MESTTSLVFILSLFLPASGGDLFDNVESFKERFDDIRKSVLPVPEDTWEEGLYQIATFYVPVDGKSEMCQNHSNYLIESVLNMDVWALKMVDASSKISSGVLDGYLIELGNFDQCVKVVAPGEVFIGQHCLVDTIGLLPEKVMDSLNPKETLFSSIRFDVKFSVCVPSTCTAEDIMIHLNTALNPVNASTKLTDNSCYSKIPEPFSAGEWAAILLFLWLFTLVVVGSVYDMAVDSGKTPYLTAFSIGSNISKMLSTKTSPADITVLNGLRVLGLSWVIIGHRFIILAIAPNIRYRDVYEQAASIWFAPMQSIGLSVDIFFFMTGVLVTYSYFRKIKKSKTFNLFHFYLLRYLRMTPSLLTVVIFVSTIGIRVNDGPLWKYSFSFLTNTCQRNWWSTLTYVSNYVNPANICLIHTWYLAADFQLFVFSPLVLIPLHKKPKLGLALTALFLVMTTVAGLWNAYTLELKTGGMVTVDRRTESTSLKEYVITHVRAAPFFIGVIIGYLIFKIKEGQLVLKMSKKTLWAGWLLSTFFILFSILFVIHFQQPDYIYNPRVDGPYLVFHRHLFTLGIAWIVLVCSLGQGGFVDKFLSWNTFIPLARLSFCVYLVHLVVQYIFTFSSRTTHSFNPTTMWYDFFADITISYAAAVILYLLVECPCANLVSAVFEGKKKSEEMPKNPQNVLNSLSTELSDIRSNSSA